jgi:aconitate hydratase 2/2-methylisocitrate dehydratase
LTHEWQVKEGNKYAKEVMQSWADAEWFTARPKLAEKITTTVLFVKGETKTNDLSPATDAWSRSDIPLHSLAMLKMTREGIHPDQHGHVGPIMQIKELKDKGFPLAFVGDVVGSGSESSHQSAANSILWFVGVDIPYVPNKRSGGICLGNKIETILLNALRDAGALVIELDVTKMSTGDIIDIYPYRGICNNHETGEQLCTFELKTPVIFDQVQAGGRVPLSIGRALTRRARESLGLEASTAFHLPEVTSSAARPGQKQQRKFSHHARALFASICLFLVLSYCVFFLFFLCICMYACVCAACA